VAVHASTSLDRAQELVGKLAEEGHDAAAFGADLRDEDATRAMIDRVRRHFGRLDALVNNAAIWWPTPIDSVAADDVRRFFEVNALSTFICCQHAGLIMAQQESGGAIVNIGDWAAARPYRNYSAYFAAKGTIPTMTRMFAVELAPRVRVNAVLPGPVLLPENLSEAERQRAISGTLLGRPGRPENVAHAVAFLLENDFITGVCLPVDGGRTIGHTE
jgi:pteridine reductase